MLIEAICGIRNGYPEIAGAPSLPRRFVRQQYVGVFPPVTPSSSAAKRFGSGHHTLGLERSP
jgi:hypothetical protein